MYILLLIILILILIPISTKIYFQENFGENNRKCLYKFNGKWSVCPENSLYPNEKCYQCPWERPYLNYKSNENCCYKKCYYKRPTGVPYYCHIGVKDTCIKKYADNKEDRYCGYHKLYQVPAKIYNTLEECKYSNPYRDLNKKQCLETNGVGWCTDYLGEGICVRGTPQGPINQMKYYQCYPNQYRTNNNSWTYTKYL